MKVKDSIFKELYEARKRLGYVYYDLHDARLRKEDLEDIKEWVEKVKEAVEAVEEVIKKMSF